MGGLDKHLNSAIRKGTIKKSNIKTNINYKKKTIIIDTEYFLKTGIKRELNENNKSTRRKYNSHEEYLEARRIRAKEKYRKLHPPKYKKYLTDEERRLIKNEKERQRYHNNREQYLSRLKKNYYEDIEFSRARRLISYHKNKHKHRHKWAENYKRKKIKTYFNNNILPYIIDNNASIKTQS